MKQTVRRALLFLPEGERLVPRKRWFTFEGLDGAIPQMEVLFSYQVKATVALLIITSWFQMFLVMGN
jgi:hypothetical protein